MKFLICFFVFAFTLSNTNAQFVAKAQLKEPVQGICNMQEVYALMPMLSGDQVEAVCPVPKEEILRRLDSAVIFVKENPTFSGKGMVSIMINCKGEIVKCEMDNKTKDTNLDSQIVAVFNALGSWKAGKLNGKTVDSIKLYSFEIKKGKISL